MTDLPRNQEFFSEDGTPYSEEEVKVELGRDASSGLFEPPNDSRLKGWRSVVHRFKRTIARGQGGRFVKRRQMDSPPEPPKWDVR